VLATTTAVTFAPAASAAAVQAAPAPAPAAAEPTVSTANPTEQARLAAQATPPEYTSPKAEPDELARAQAEAARTGRRVELAGATTETSVTFALPDGRWQVESGAGPLRVRQGTAWVPVDHHSERDC